MGNRSKTNIMSVYVISFIVVVTVFALLVTIYFLTKKDTDLPEVDNPAPPPEEIFIPLQTAYRSPDMRNAKGQFVKGHSGYASTRDSTTGRFIKKKA